MIVTAIVEARGLKKGLLTFLIVTFTLSFVSLSMVDIEKSDCWNVAV